MKIRPVKAEMHYAERRTDIHDKADSGSSQFLEHADQSVNLHVSPACNIKLPV